MTDRGRWSFGRERWSFGRAATSHDAQRRSAFEAPCYCAISTIRDDSIIR
jgi:hypothetical protein